MSFLSSTKTMWLYEMLNSPKSYGDKRDNLVRVENFIKCHLRRIYTRPFNFSRNCHLLHKITSTSTSYGQTLFNLKDKIKHVVNVVYLGTHLICTCKADYIRETCKNFKTWQSEQENPNYNSKPDHHITLNKEHCFEWKVLNTAKQWKLWKFKNAIYIIVTLKPSLNKQIKSFELCLFPSGITQ